MNHNELESLSRVRYQRARECLADAKILQKENSYKSAANRAYYAVFHGMRSILALDNIDRKHHSGIISEFRLRYIKTAIFPLDFSNIIAVLESTRTESDYDDFFIISKEEVIQQIKDAEYFLDGIRDYLYQQSVLSVD